MPGYNLKYFDLPALGEPIRLLLHLGKFEWEDQTMNSETWPAFKPQTKWGQMPVLTTPDGKELTQTKAIARFLAKQVSLDGAKIYPEDPWAAFEVDEMIDAFEDVRAKLVPTFAIQDQAEKEAARQKLFGEDGAATQLLTKIEALAGEKHIVGSSLNLADLWAFFFLNFLRCGFFDGIPKDYLSKYPKLTALVASVAAVPEIKAYYDKKDATTNPLYAPFKA